MLLSTAVHRCRSATESEGMLLGAPELYDVIAQYGPAQSHEVLSLSLIRTTITLLNALSDAKLLGTMQLSRKWPSIDLLPLTAFGTTITPTIDVLGSVFPRIHPVGLMPSLRSNSPRSFNRINPHEALSSPHSKYAPRRLLCFELRALQGPSRSNT